MTDWLDEQAFYEAMQAYRHAPVADQAAVIAAFEEVKRLIREREAAAAEMGYYDGMQAHRLR